MASVCLANALLLHRWRQAIETIPPQKHQRGGSIGEVGSATPRSDPLHHAIGGGVPICICPLRAVRVAALRSGQKDRPFIRNQVLHVREQALDVATHVSDDVERRPAASIAGITGARHAIALKQSGEAPGSGTALQSWPFEFGAQLDHAAVQSLGDAIRYTDPSEDRVPLDSVSNWP